MNVLYYDDKDLKDMPDEILNSLIDFIKEVWDPHMTREKFFNKRNYDFKENPFMTEGGSPITLLIDKNRVIGHCISTPCQLWAINDNHLMFWNSGLHLKDECRGKGLGIVLPQKLTESLPIISGFFVVPQQLRTHEKLKYNIVGQIKEYVKILHPENLLKKIDLTLIKSVPQFLLWIPGPPHSRRRRVFAFVVAKMYDMILLLKSRQSKVEINKDIKFVKEFDHRLDQLWDRVKPKIKFAQVRNSKYLNWQFRSKDGWEKIIIENNGRIDAYAIIASKTVKKHPKLKGLKITSIVDMLWDFDSSSSLQQLISFVESHAVKNGTDLLICSINHPLATRYLKKKAFIKLPDTVYFVIKSNQENVKLSSDLNDWYMTRGDADAAGSLGPDEVQ